MSDAFRGAERLLAAVLVGVLLGVFSVRGDGSQVMVINGLANAAAPWVVAAFAAGALQRTPGLAAAGGTVALLVGVAIYYGSFVLAGHGFLLPFVAAWAVAGTAAGVLFGSCGFAWRGRSDGWRVVAVALLAGALLAEAADRLIMLEIWTGIDWERTYMQVALANIVCAAAAVLLLIERRRWPATFAAVIPAAAAGLLAFLAAGQMRFG